VRDELEHYLEERAREFEAQGMAPGDARRAAAAAFGDVDRIESQVRNEDGAPRGPTGRRWRMEGMIEDVRFALRTALRNPGLTVVIVLMLGLGIGATTAIFTVVNASLIRALPFADAEELVFLQGAYAAPEGPQVRGASYLEAGDWARLSRSFTRAAPFEGTAATLTGVERAERIPIETVGSGYFEILRVEPLVGRAFAAEEHALDGSGAAVLIGEELWARLFGTDPAVLGRSLTLDATTYEVVGVLPRTFAGASLDAQAWIPLEAAGVASDGRGTRYLGVVARLRPGVSIEQAQADMDGLTARLEAEHPVEHEGRVALVTPLREVYLGSTRTLMLVILSATGLLLLIAAANVTNLLLVRASGRRSEMLVRSALGAGRARMGAQLVTESLVLALLGAGAGLIVGLWGARALASAMPDALLPAYVVVTPDLRVLGLTAALMAVVGILGGMAPAWQAARTDLATGLRRGGIGRRRASLQQVLVVGEVALAFLLLVGAGLMTRSFLEQLDVRPGFDADRLHAFAVRFPPERYGGEAREAAAREILALLEARPEITSASLGSDAPLVSGYSASYIWTDGSELEDRIRFYRHHVLAGYFETMGIPLLAGRAFAASDETPVAVISRAMAERHYPGRNPVGESLRYGGPDGEPVRIVGVAADVRYRDLTTDLVAGASDPDVFIPWDQAPTTSVTVVSRAVGDPATLDGVVREVVAAFDPDLAVFDSGPLARGLVAETAQGRFGTLLLGVFGGLAVLLCALGLYGVLSFAVARRTRELAVRVAVGAPSGRLRWMVVRQGMLLMGVGVVLGALASVWAARALQAFLFGVGATDPATYAAVGALLAGVALAATYLPALRATRVDPQTALKAE
jgi:putative ABC transport system permease protein